MAGVNSFGFGGANAHVILDGAAATSARASMPKRSPTRLADRAFRALRGRAARLRIAARRNGSTSASNANGDSPVLPDLAYTLGARRNHHPHRLTLVAHSMTELIQELDAFARETGEPEGPHLLHAAAASSAPRIAFVMSGQGPQWWGMGRELMQHEPVFRADDRALRRGDATVGALFAARRTRPRRGDLADAPHRDRAAGDFRDAGRAGGAVEIVGRAAGGDRRPQRRRNRRGLRRRRVSAWKKARGSSCLRARFMDGCARGEGTMLAVGLAKKKRAR